jgi:hypothetical protein
MGLREFLGLPNDYQVFIDNGAFHSLTHEVPFDVRGYRRFIGKADADWYPIPVEHIPHPSMSRRKQRDLYRKTMIYNRGYAPQGFVPIAHVGACLPQFLDCFERMNRKTTVERLGLGAMVPFLLRGKGSDGRTRVVDDIISVRSRLPDTRIHGFGIGGTATLHIAAVLGLDSVDSSGWRNRAARGIVQLRGTGDRVVADFGKWRGRRLSPKERKGLCDCGCPSCRVGGPRGLEKGGIVGFASRATHNLWVLAEEAAEIGRRFSDPSYYEWIRSHIDNRVFIGLIDHAIEAAKTSGLTVPCRTIQEDTNRTKKALPAG